MASSSIKGRFKADSVCIIGAGLSGLTAAKYLIAEQTFARLVIYERGSDVGGLWNYTPCENGMPDEISVPQTDPNIANPQPWISPIYDRLEANNPRNVMRYSDLEWPVATPLFPKHQQTLRYLRSYGKAVRHLIKFRTQVMDVQPDDEGKWTVRIRRESQGEQEPLAEERYDAVIVANGHFEVPHVPKVPGIDAFRRAYPSAILHAKYYRDPEKFAQKKVIVVGNSASGVDIGHQITSYCRKPLMLSSRSESFLANDPPEGQIFKPAIARFLVEDRAVQFADGSIECHIDAVVYCTGYLYSFPFLHSLQAPVITTGQRVCNLYQHIFYHPNPTLSFMVLNQRVLPFPTAEAQAAVIARVLSGRAALPSPSEMAMWEQERLASVDREKDFHVLNYPNDCDYTNMLHDWAMRIDRTGDVGKVPQKMDAQKRWTRERFPKIRQAYQALGEQRYEARTLEDVGFDFEAWKRETAVDDAVVESARDDRVSVHG